MFGKRKSSADQFVMAAGKAVGNLKEPTKKSPTAQPMKKKDPSSKTGPVSRVTSPRQKLGAAGHLKKALR